MVRTGNYAYESSQCYWGLLQLVSEVRLIPLKNGMFRHGASIHWNCDLRTAFGCCQSPNRRSCHLSVHSRWLLSGQSRCRDSSQTPQH